MKKFYYDLHIHSCLSPCADNDMTPNNMCGMAAIKGLNIIALTDHNSCGNCKSFLKAAENNGIVGVAGMELTTSEDIHMVFLFEFLDEAAAFSDELGNFRTPFENRVDIFGKQLYLDENDEELGEEKYFLPVATSLSIDDAYALGKKYNAFIYPAHIDREANGIVAVLGTLPESPYFSSYELHDAAELEKYKELIPSLSEKTVIVSSDAHYLWDINEAENFVMLDTDSDDADEIRHKLFEYLKGQSGVL